MQAQLNTAIKAARRAGDIICRSLEKLDTIKVSNKGQNDFVTSIDVACENDIIKTIELAYPDNFILGEENGGSIDSNIPTWIIDPIDGTMNFMHGYPSFCVSIALMHKGSIECGVIYDPINQELFTAIKGKGAQLNDRRIRVSQTTELKRSFLATGFPVRKPEELDTYLDLFKNVLKSSSDVRSKGSAALDLAYVACGRLDGYYESGLAIWDLAAGTLIVREAGGFVTDFKGQDDFLTNGQVIAATPKILNEIVKLTNKI